MGRSTTFGRGKKGADNKGATIRAQQKGRRTKRAQSNKGAEQKGRRAKRAQNKKGAKQKGRKTKRTQNKKGARSRCCVTVTFKVVISSDNRVLSQSFFFFFFFVETYNTFITFALFKICFNKKLENGRKLQHKTMILRIESYLIDRIKCFA